MTESFDNSASSSAAGGGFAARRCPLILEVEREGARFDAVDEFADIIGLPAGVAPNPPRRVMSTSSTGAGSLRRSSTSFVREIRHRR